MKCPQCKTENPVRVIHGGFPLWFCKNGTAPDGEQCSCLWGFWMFILHIIPFNGHLFVYDHKRFPYPVALWKWLTND